MTMGKRRARTVSHAEGGHGPKTERRIIEQLESGPSRGSVAEGVELDRMLAAHGGKRRLVEDREQHDEAEKNSERTQLFEETRQGRADEGPSDNSGNLHGVIGTRNHRSDYKQRGSDGVAE
jgi:hypothetical protein